MAHRYGAGKGHGFTLVELLIAIAILGISMSLVYGVYHSILGGAEQAERNASSLSRNLLVRGQLQRDFYGIYKGRSGFFRAEDPLTLESGTPFLEFTSSSQLSFDEAAAAPALTRVGYYLEKTGKGSRYSLYRYEIPFKLSQSRSPGTGPVALLVCADVRGLSLRYKDAYGNFFEQWLVRSGTPGSGYDDDRFPNLVRVELLLDEGDAERSEPESFTASFHVPLSRVAGKSADEGG